MGDYQNKVKKATSQTVFNGQELFVPLKSFDVIQGLIKENAKLRKEVKTNRATINKILTKLGKRGI